MSQATALTAALARTAPPPCTPRRWDPARKRWGDDVCEHFARCAQGQACGAFSRYVECGRATRGAGDVPSERRYKRLFTNGKDEGPPETAPLAGGAT